MGKRPKRRSGLLGKRVAHREQRPELVAGERAVRSDPNTPFQDYLRGLIEVPAGAQIRVLDVGAGPLTTIGRKWPGRELHITAVDPLAAEYDDLLRKLEIDPPCRTAFAFAEELSAIFTPSSFDLVHSRNAIDRSKDVLKAIKTFGTFPEWRNWQTQQTQNSARPSL